MAHVIGNNPAQLRHKGSHVPHTRSRGSPDIPDLDAEAIVLPQEQIPLQ